MQRNQFLRIDRADEDIGPYPRYGHAFAGDGVLTVPRYLNVEVTKIDFPELFEKIPCIQGKTAVQ